MIGWTAKGKKGDRKGKQRRKEIKQEKQRTNKSIYRVNVLSINDPHESCTLAMCHLAQSSMLPRSKCRNK